MTTFKLIITSCAILLISNLFQYGQCSNESTVPQQQQQQQKQCTYDDDGGGGDCNNMNMNTNTNMNTDMDVIHTAFKWNIDGEHRCNIKKLSFKELYKRFNYGLPPLYHEPLVLYYEDENNYNNHNGDSGSNGSNGSNDDINNNNHESQCIYSKFEHMSSIENITKTTFPQNFEVTLSSSNSFSAHRRTIPLSQYIDETMNHEIFPNQLSNLTWYLFGETYSNEWKEVLSNYCLPPCQTCTDDLRYVLFNLYSLPGCVCMCTSMHMIYDLFSNEIFLLLDKKAFFNSF
jgi:hypothetical protein